SARASEALRPEHLIDQLVHAITSHVRQEALELGGPGTPDPLRRVPDALRHWERQATGSERREQPAGRSRRQPRRLREAGIVYVGYAQRRNLCRDAIHSPARLA